MGGVLGLFFFSFPLFWDSVFFFGGGGGKKDRPPSILQCSHVQYSTIHNAFRLIVALHSFRLKLFSVKYIVQCETVQCSVSQYNILHCGVFQYSIVHCSVLQYTKVQCSVYQYTTLHCGVFQYTKVYCSTLQYSAVYLSTLQHIVPHLLSLSYSLAIWCCWYSCCFRYFRRCSWVEWSNYRPINTG